MLATKIMVAYDGSDHSIRALEWALAAQTEKPVEIDVVTVITPMVIPVSYEVPNMGMSLRALDQSHDAAKKEEMDLLVRKYADKGYTLKTHILKGNIAESLLDHSAKSGAELIVTGSRGESGFTRLLLGSIAEKLVTYAKVPVVVVK